MLVAIHRLLRAVSGDFTPPCCWVALSGSSSVPRTWDRMGEGHRHILEMGYCSCIGSLRHTSLPHSPVPAVRGAWGMGHRAWGASATATVHSEWSFSVKHWAKTKHTRSTRWPYSSPLKWVMLGVCILREICRLREVRLLAQDLKYIRCLRSYAGLLCPHL